MGAGVPRSSAVSMWPATAGSSTSGEPGQSRTETWFLAPSATRAADGGGRSSRAVRGGGGEDKGVYFRNTPKPNTRQIVSAAQRLPVHCGAFSPDGRWFATAGSPGPRVCHHGNRWRILEQRYLELHPGSATATRLVAGRKGVAASGGWTRKRGSPVEIAPRRTGEGRFALTRRTASPVWRFLS